jgi:hypothetical protein
MPCREDDKGEVLSEDGIHIIRGWGPMDVQADETGG